MTPSIGSDKNAFLCGASEGVVYSPADVVLALYSDSIESAQVSTLNCSTEAENITKTSSITKERVTVLGRHSKGIDCL